MEQLIQNIKDAFDTRITDTQDIARPLERLIEVTRSVDETLGEIASIIIKDGFDESAAEISYFKNTRVEILSYRIEECLKYNVIMNVPVGTKEVRQRYFEDQSKAIQCFFLMNNVHYRYYVNGSEELDGQYFLRKSKSLQAITLEIPDTGSEMSTPMSSMFAKFKAYEKVHGYILEQLAILDDPEGAQLPRPDRVTQLRWTGDAINIVELAYGLWLTGQLDHGNASLNQIVRWLETNLQVKIGIVQRRFSEIERRKRLSPTKFLDQMRDALIKKIDVDLR